MNEKINGYRVNAVLTTKNIQKNTLTVNVSVDSFKDMGIFVRITHKDIISYLENEKGMKIESCLFSSVISNTSDESLLGTWIFQLPGLPSFADDAEVINLLDKKDEGHFDSPNLSLQPSPNNKKKKILKEE